MFKMYELPKDEVKNESYTFKDAWSAVERENKIAQITNEFMRILYQRGDYKND